MAVDHKMSDLFNVDYSYNHLFSVVDSNMSREINASDDVLFPSGLDGATLVVVANLFDRLVAPIVVIAGLIGNLVALFVFSERSMQRRSSNVYLPMYL